MPDELPPISKFLPPAPDVMLGGVAKIVGEILKTPLKAGKALGGVVDAVAGQVEGAIDEVETLPGRE